MKKGFGLLLILTFILTLGTIVQTYRFDSSAQHERSSALSLQREVGSVEVALADLRAAQAAYLAVGQDHRFWMQRASDLSTQLADGLTRLATGSPVADARPRYDAARAALTDLEQVDKRARDYVNGGQPALASDIVFVEGLAATQRIQTELAGARDAEAAIAATRLLRTDQYRLAMTAALVGFLLIVAIAGARAATQNPAPVAASDPSSTAQMLRDLPPPVKMSSPGTATRVTAPVAPPPPINLTNAAEVCVDLARVIDPRDIPALLERAANALDAKGVILWVADTAGSTLRPSLAHGYADKVLQRLGQLPVESDNVTSLAYRTLRPQTMNGAAPGSAGAVAVPLVTSSGCLGVLSAETRLMKPPTETVAVARMIAAQFAALVGPAPEAGEADLPRAAQA